MYELHKLIDQIKIDRASYEYDITQGDDLRKVQENLNNRMISLRQRLVETPDNKNLNFELAFCEAEIERINDELDEYSKNNENKAALIKQHKTIIEYNLRELYSYTDLLERVEVDEKLVKSIKESIDSLDKNLTILEGLQKE